MPLVHLAFSLNISGMSRNEITDEQWNQIKDYLPPETGRRGRPAKCNRMIVNAFLWILKAGALWRDLPPSYGSWDTEAVFIFCSGLYLFMKGNI